MRRPSGSATAPGVSAAGDILLEDLEAGDCVRRLPGRRRPQPPAVPCGDPHRAEVYAVFDLAEPASGDYPGDEEVRRLTDGGCERRALELRLPADGYAAVSFSPDEGTWDVGDREVLCLLEAEQDTSGPLPRGVGDGAPA